VLERVREKAGERRVANDDVSVARGTFRPANVYPAGVELNVAPAGLHRFTPARRGRDDEGDLSGSGSRQDREELRELLNGECARSRPVVRGEARREKRLDVSEPQSCSLGELERGAKSDQFLGNGVGGSSPPLPRCEWCRKHGPGRCDHPPTTLGADRETLEAVQARDPLVVEAHSFAAQKVRAGGGTRIAAWRRRGPGVGRAGPSAQLADCERSPVHGMLSARSW
jgi:hypothetical protein